MRSRSVEIWASQREEEKWLPLIGGKELRMPVYENGCGGKGGNIREFRAPKASLPLQCGSTVPLLRVE